MTCIHCGEEVAPDDIDPAMGCPAGMSVHQVCSVRMMIGSLGHQLRLCSCPGRPGVMDDPPGLTLHEAARAAAAFFEETKHVGRY